MKQDTAMTPTADGLPFRYFKVKDGASTIYRISDCWSIEEDFHGRWVASWMNISDLVDDSKRPCDGVIETDEHGTPLPAEPSDPQPAPREWDVWVHPDGEAGHIPRKGDAPHEAFAGAGWRKVRVREIQPASEGAEDEFWPCSMDMSRRQLVERIGQMNFRLTALKRELQGRPTQRELSAARAEAGRLQCILDAAIRLRGRYLPWTNAGGPNECIHGYAEGIPCPSCDQETLNKAEDAMKAVPAPNQAHPDRFGKRASARFRDAELWRGR